MKTTELLFPVFKQDAETQDTLEYRGPEIFSHFVGLDGLRFFARGTVLYEDGKPLETNERGVLVLEWDDPSSFYAFYPNSPKFAEFIQVAKPLVAAPDVPELFATVSSAEQTASAKLTQIIKVKQEPNTEFVWSKLRDTLFQGKDATPVFSHARGIEKQEGLLMGMIGWERVEDYERSRADEAVTGIINELGSAGKVLDVVVQLEPMAV
ncbi:uncharacterized protein BDV17DRAFT_293324 [Aspergillus undulatus]|uniref:uncharacterized protein n=1 Tax=Aspergillus undulatus TaxID=1810928 RepID=UPI003CCCE906